jgi:hypothetical protein
MWVHSTLDQIPSRVLRPPLDRPARRPDPSPLRFPCPSTASSSEPLVGRVVQPRPGSALRFSQPLSGFSLLEFHGLVSCRNRSWASSLQSLPLTEIVYPSRGHWLPCGHPPTCWTALLRGLSPPVSPTSTLSRSCLVPPAAMGSLSADARSASRSPWANERKPPVPPASPASKLSSPRESVRAVPGSPRLGGRCSPGLSPLQSTLPDLGASDPLQGPAAPPVGVTSPPP